MAARSSDARPASVRELEWTRVLDAWPDDVFRAWTEPEELAAWWGPHGFTTPVCELDVRAGGAIDVEMRAPNGTVYPLTGAFREMDRPHRFVVSTVALDPRRKPVLETLTAVTIAERGAKTALTVRLRVVHATPEAAPYLEGMEAGWTETLDRLEAHVTGA